ncbi:eukaryotic translation initiation factor 4e transporter [Holotrichia oblita]|uniref:Eukaryotic translation initiation factor 4e transporter n=1 Tax=Holotrichia oblita TaxID=644536 RepID=A0ACB9SRL3_HOLOL|nr:eukaryotic translation initiation factor 4e transporter [Holotrichia oblita]
MSLNRTAVDVPSSTDVSVERINDMLDRLDITKEEDEEVEFVTSRSPSVEMSDLGDPAILQVGITASCSVKFKYTKDHLIKLKESPFSLKRPEYLDSAYDNNNGIWDPERWHFDRKTSDPSAENGSRGNDMDNNHRRRSGDPRDRIRKEHDGIVLSPQRRSFNSGCYVPVREPARSNRSHSPIGKGEASHIGHREISQGPSSRRIGSGRIFFDYPEKTEADNDFGYRRERRDTDRERDERYERRSFSRESEPNRPNKSKEGGFTRNGARYDRRRISNESREEEPEWFSEGPMSQHDTIELRGFDDAERSGVAPSSSSNKKKMTAAQKKKAKERGAKNVENSAQNSSKEDVGKQEGPGARSTPTLLEAGSADLMSQSPIGGDKGAAGDTSEASNVRNSAILEDQLFTIEDMLKSDNINMLLPNGVGLESGDTSGSKFSRWFSREKSPPPTAANQKQSDGSRRSSLHDDHHHLIKNILNDISEPTVSIPCDSNSYFAPISPAASTGSVSANPGHPQAAAQPINFMEILQRSGKHQGGPLHADLPPTMKNMEVPGKLLCVEELETRIRQGDKGNPGEASTNIRMSASKHNKTKEDNSAFQKLLAQMQDGHVIPASNGPIPQQKTTQPMSIMEMLSHSQKQEEAARLAQMMNSSVSQGHLSNDLNYKLQQSQVQQRQIEVFSKLLASGVRQQQARTPPPLNDIGLAGRELLNRPEAQAILQGLKRGDITPQHLYQQLANPAMQSRHRELLQMILKLQSPSVAAGSRVLSPVPPHPMFQQQQQLRVSPLPPNGFYFVLCYVFHFLRFIIEDPQIFLFLLFYLQAAYCVSPILATSPNTLTVPAMHQRIPSPRELQVHTQNIMQRALIKKKLEEQQENFRKKQELQQTGQSPGGISPAKNVGSPTQLAFTPTAVLRKMTAEKDEGSKDAANKNNDTQTKSHQQGRAVTGMRNQGQPSQQQAGSQTQQTVQQQVENQGQIKQVQQQTQWNTQFQQMNKQPAGIDEIITPDYINIYKYEKAGTDEIITPDYINI